eukprot:SAG11_NODE_19143_length_473_cov_1.085561_2_plen_132_part_01
MVDTAKELGVAAPTHFQRNNAANTATRLDRWFASTLSYEWVQEFSSVNARIYEFDHHLITVKIIPDVRVDEGKFDRPSFILVILKSPDYDIAVRDKLKDIIQNWDFNDSSGEQCVARRRLSTTQNASYGNQI